MSYKLITIISSIWISVGFAVPTHVKAAESDLNAAILQIALDWERTKFEVDDKTLQETQMAALEQRAEAVAQKYQNRPEAAIWLGIIISEQASMASENGSPFKALGLARRARDLLEPIANAYPAALDAGASTSLGVLYYRVPGFPIGFGDKSKARQLLEEAVKYAPDGLDANYFYGDFLFEQHEYPTAERVFKHALSLPAHPERPIWDKSRRLVMQEDLAKIPSN